MGSWKRLLGTARNAPLDLLPRSIPNSNFVLTGVAVGLDAEVVRIVLAKARNPLLRNLVYPEVLRHDLMNTSIRRQSTLMLMKGAANAIPEAQVQTTRLSGESKQSVEIPSSANTLSRMLQAQDILATAASSVSLCTESNISLLSGATLPWREPCNQAQKEASCSSVTAGHSMTQRLPDDKRAASAPVDILETVCDMAREVMGTVIDTSAPLMSAGLDSIAAVEFTSTLSARLRIDI